MTFFLETERLPREWAGSSAGAGGLSYLQQKCLPETGLHPLFPKTKPQNKDIWILFKEYHQGTAATAELGRRKGEPNS